MGASFFCFVTIHAFDRQTDGQTDKRPCNTVRLCIFPAPLDYMALYKRRLLSMSVVYF